MISGRVDSTTIRQLIIANHDNKNYYFERTTNGGRGESNAWRREYGFNSDNNNYLVNLIGEIVGTQLTTVDTDSLTADEMPNVLIQKLTKQYRNRDTEIVTTSKTMKDVVDDVLQIIYQDPSKLAQYHTDGRSNRTTERKVVTPTIATPRPIAPVIRITHENYKEDSLSFVPSMSDPEVSGYVNRKFAGTSDFDVLDYALANNQNVSIVGEAGTGKTTCVLSWAGNRGMRFYRINFNAGVESSQLFGKLLPNEEGKLVWQDGGFTECWRNGNAVIVLDEMSFMPQKQSGVLFPSLDSSRKLILLDNKGEVIPAGDNVLVVGCWNDGYRGNNKPNQAFIDRFHHKLVFDYDIEIERKFIRSSTLLDLAKQMRADSIAGIYETPISTRLLKNFQQFASEISYDYAVDNFLNNFTGEERGSVKLLLDAHRHNLEAELV